MAQFASIEGPVTAPSLGGVDGTGIVNLPFAPTAAPAEQPGPSQNLDICCGDSRFNSNFVLQNGALWAVRPVAVSGRAAVEWFQFDPDTNAILQTGRITDDELDLFYPSIAVNEFDQVVIGCNGSSESQFVSAYAVLGETIGGVTTFGELLLLKEGIDSYELVWDDRNRWGDYSTTVVDPSDSSVFWTFQEWADFGGSEWATQITQLRVVSDSADCADGLDNDGDGLTDLDDPGCVDPADLDERDPLLPCDDGADNDGDGRADFDPMTFANPGDEATLPSGSGDPGCKNPTWFSEDPRCQNGIDDDGDGMMDYDAGLSRNGVADPGGPEPTCVNPYHNRETSCGLGAELALLLPPLMWLHRRRGRRL